MSYIGGVGPLPFEAGMRACSCFALIFTSIVGVFLPLRAGQFIE